MTSQTTQGEVGSREQTTKSKQNDQQKMTRKDSGSRGDDNCSEFWEDEKHFKVGQEEYRKFKESQNNTEGNQTDAKAPGETRSDGEDTSNQPKKRGLGANASAQSLKKQKNGDYRAGDKTRVPHKGQMVQWEVSKEVLEGEVIEVVYEEKEIEGEAIKASKEEPQIVIRNKSSGKTSVQYPADVNFA